MPMDEVDDGLLDALLGFDEHPKDTDVVEARDGLDPGLTAFPLERSLKAVSLQIGCNIIILGVKQQEWTGG